jgi:hypothetical protein
MDLAFFGLSTMTREWPLREDSSASRDFFAGAFLDAAVALVADRFRDAGFEGLPLPLGLDAADFFATVSS